MVSEAAHEPSAAAHHATHGAVMNLHRQIENSSKEMDPTHSGRSASATWQEIKDVWDGSDDDGYYSASDNGSDYGDEPAPQKPHRRESHSKSPHAHEHLGTRDTASPSGMRVLLPPPPPPCFKHEGPPRATVIFLTIATTIVDLWPSYSLLCSTDVSDTRWGWVVSSDGCQ